MDAVVAVTIMECSIQSSALLGGVNVLHSAFPEDADLEYSTQSETAPTSPQSTPLLSQYFRKTYSGETGSGGEGER